MRYTMPSVAYTKRASVNYISDQLAVLNVLDRNCRPSKAAIRRALQTNILDEQSEKQSLSEASGYTDRLLTIISEPSTIVSLATFYPKCCSSI